MTGIALVLGAMGLALIVSLARLGGGIATARARMRDGAPRGRFQAAVDAALAQFPELKPYVVERDAGGIDIDCTELQLRFEGTVDACTVYGRLSAYDRWMPLDRVLGDGFGGGRPVAAQAQRIAQHAERLQSRLLVASAEH